MVKQTVVSRTIHNPPTNLRKEKGWIEWTKRVTKSGIMRYPRFRTKVYHPVKRRWVNGTPSGRQSRPDLPKSKTETEYKQYVKERKKQRATINRLKKQARENGR